jgi:hypothetical protein
MISIVNRTVFTSPDNNPLLAHSATIPSTTAGNTLVVIGMADGLTGAGSPKLGTTLMNHPNGEWGSGISFLQNIPGGQTQLNWGVGILWPMSAVIYELTPCTRDISVGAMTPSSGNLNVTPSGSETGVVLNSASNAAYFQVISQDSSGGSYNSVSSPWSLDFTVSPLPQILTGMGSVALILNTSGSKTPVWNVTSGGAHCGVCAITFLDSGPSAPPCQISSGGSVVSTYLSDLGLNIAPATELFKQYVNPATIATSEYTTEGRNAIVMDFSSGDGLYSRDIEVAFSWALSNHIALRLWQPSIIPMPENQYNRPTDWIDGGTSGNKFIQGITVEADSFNLQKTFQLQSGDDLSLHSLNEMPATFPKQTIKTFSCVVPFLAHNVRLFSVDSVAWRVWTNDLIFEPWPSQVTNWQSEMTSFGMTGWLHARELNVAYAAAQAITVNLVPDTGPTVTLTLPSTGGATIQNKTKLTLPPMKFKLLSVQVVSTAPFYLFETDLEFKIKPWGSTDPYQVLKVVGGLTRPGAKV